jgi:hypothetical protein
LNWSLRLIDDFRAPLSHSAGLPDQVPVRILCLAKLGGIVTTIAAGKRDMQDSSG